MAIDLLDSPLRVTWDLHGPAGFAPSAPLVAARLADAGVFFVTLEQRPLAHPQIVEVLDVLRDGGCRTLLVCGGDDDELAALRRDLPMDGLFLDAAPWVQDESFDRAGLSMTLARLREKGCDPALLLVPRPGNISLIPALLAFCREQKVGKFKLPNTPIDVSFSPSAGKEFNPLRPDDVDRLRRAVGDDAAAHRRGVALEVHDLFLWEVLFPGGEEGRSEYGGCQAGNSLGHVDAGGALHPCSSWPQSLGSLLDHPLADLWNSPERSAIRAEIQSLPDGCLGCRDYPVCLGGCRGLARTLKITAGQRDLLCRGPRG